MVKKLLIIKSKYFSKEKIKETYSRFILFLKTSFTAIRSAIKTVIKNRYGFRNAFKYSTIFTDFFIFCIVFGYIGYYYYLSIVNSTDMFEMFESDFLLLVTILYLNKHITAYLLGVIFFILVKFKKNQLSIYKDNTLKLINGKKTIVLNSYLTIKFFLFLGNNFRICFNYTVIIVKRFIIFVYFFVLDSIRGYFTLRGQHNKS